MNYNEIKQLKKYFNLEGVYNQEFEGFELLFFQNDIIVFIYKGDRYLSSKHLMKVDRFLKNHNFKKAYVLSKKIGIPATWFSEKVPEIELRHLESIEKEAALIG